MCFLGMFVFTPKNAASDSISGGTVDRQTAIITAKSCRTEVLASAAHLHPCQPNGFIKSPSFAALEQLNYIMLIQDTRMVTALVCIWVLLNEGAGAKDLCIAPF